MQPLSPRDPSNIADYTLIGRLGSGGMGVVYLANKKSINYALKVIRESLSDDPTYSARFDGEIRTLQSIDHPAVAHIIEAGETDGRSWYASEFVNGPSLEAYVTSNGPLGEETWDSVARGVLEALHAVHELDIIHRDIKPSNILLSDAGPKIIDFGVARMADATSLTETGSTPGSPAWFSPEQIEGHELSIATDYFSLGSTLTFAATGETPWGAKTGINYASVMRVLVKPPQLDGLSPRQRSIVEPLLDKNPNTRLSAVPSVLTLVSDATAPTYTTTPLVPRQEVVSTPPETQPNEPTVAQPVTQDSGLVSDAPPVVRAEEKPHSAGPSESAPPGVTTEAPNGSRRKILIAGVVSLMGAVVLALLVPFFWGGGGPTNVFTQAPTSQFFDGTHLVGQEVSQGIYRADGGDSCYWERLAVSRAGEETTIEAGFTRIVEVAATDDLFYSSGCGTWEPLAATYPTTPATEFSDGTHMVSQHIAPGTYRAAGPEWCSWEFWTGFTGIFDEYVRGGGQTIVEILTSDTAFHSDGCGSWQPLNLTIRATPAPEFSDGTWVVGAEVPPGTYWSSGGEYCMVARLSGFTGDWEDTIASNYSSIVELEPTDVGVDSRDCGPWIPLQDSAPPSPAQTFSNGTHAIGVHIEPGIYQGSGGSDWCRWERLSGFSVDFDDIIGSGDSPLVEIFSGDAGISSSGCGTWERMPD